jgi:hypothetical protein
MADIPTQEEIDAVLNKAAEQTEKGGTKWPGMSYEQGVENAILWMQGVYDNPMDE